MENWTQKIIDASNALKEHRLTLNGVFREMGRAAPLVGGWFAAGTNLHEMMTGAQFKFGVGERVGVAIEQAREQRYGWQAQGRLLGAWGPGQAFAEIEEQRIARTNKLDAWRKELGRAKDLYPMPAAPASPQGFSESPEVKAWRADVMAAYENKKAAWARESGIPELEREIEAGRLANMALPPVQAMAARRKLLAEAMSPMESFGVLATQLQELKNKGQIGGDLFTRLYNANRPQATAEQFDPWAAVGMGNPRFSTTPPSPQEMAVWERIAVGVEKLVNPPGTTVIEGDWM
jgi:hypothetical protein